MGPDYQGNRASLIAFSFGVERRRKCLPAEEAFPARLDHTERQYCFA